jgi:hypothetical protein
MIGSFMQKKYSSTKIQDDYVKSLDEDIKDSLIWYTGDDYSGFNRYLRNLRSKKYSNSTYEMHLKNIDYAFAHAPPLEVPITVYKGVIGSEVFSDKAFISASKYYENTLKFAESYKQCCVLEITVSKGSKILPLQSLTKYKDEEEVLLDRNGSLICTEQYMKKDKVNRYMKVLVCVYAKGLEIESSKDIKEISEELAYENFENKIIERILNNVDEDELILYSNDNELKQYINSIYKQLKVPFILEKDVVEIILSRIKSKYSL